jgi:small-conductance mechanosensitive channel
MSSLKKIFIGILFLLFTINTVAVFGQSEGPRESVADSTVAKESIPISEIIGKSAEDQEYLMKIRNDLYTDVELDQFHTEIDSIIYEFNINHDDINAETEGLYRFQELERKKRVWLQLYSHIKNKADELKSSVDKLSKGFDRTERIIETWENTLTGITDSSILAALYGRVHELLLVSDTVRGQFRTQLQLLISEQTRLVDYEIRSNEILKEIDGRLDERKVSKISITQDPLWNLRSHTYDSLTILHQVSLALRDENESLGLFIENSFDDILTYILVLFICLGVFLTLFLRIRKKKLTDTINGDITFISKLYRFPLFLSLVISAYTFYFVSESAPPLFMEFVMLSVCIGLVPLIYTLFPNRTSYLIYLFILIFLITRILDYTWVQTVNIRLVNVGVIITSMAGLWLLRSSLRSNPVTKRNFIRKIFIILISFCMILLIVALIANIAGAGELSGIITDGVVRLVVASVLFFVTMLILEGLLHLFIHSDTMMSVHLFKKNSEAILRSSLVVIRVIFFFFFINSILRITGLSIKMREGLEVWLTDTRTLGDFEFTFGSILLFILIIYLSTVISRILKAIIEDGILYNFNLRKGLAMSVGTLTKYIIVTAGFLVAASAAGLSMDKVTVLVGAFGVGIGFGLQNIFNNLVSGLILLFDRPIQVQDTVEVGTLMGKVQRIGLRASYVRTFDGAEVIVPNGEFISKEVINWTLSDKQRRMELKVGVAYGSDLQQVKELITGVLDAHTDVIKYPKPLILFEVMNDSSLDFRILFWTDNYDEWLRIRSEVLFNIYHSLVDAGITIPYPQRDLHIKDISSIEEKLKGKENEK